MKKIFSKEIFLLPLFLILSFFLFSFNVNADTTLTIPDNDFSYINSDFYEARQLALDYVNTNGGYYFIDYVNNMYRINVFSTLSSGQSFEVQYNTTNFRIVGSFNYARYKVENGQLSLLGNYNFYQQYINISDNTTSSYYIYLDTNYNLHSLTTTTNFTFSYLNVSYPTFNIFDTFPSLYNLYIYKYPPTPPDDTPILTDFYTLIIDKFSVIADFFTDNTYLFAIPLIPILILCIYFIKRSLIK